ncbi:cytochrome c [Exilibacterium tricleocarpae]|uniref:Cytochrome c n=1 Tax=Exilibacterium tricleocarpae TaxID=2591008 RepID=A0A545TQB1_9GAMM|nr:cytochrome c [Exilibacterium tricleocarpae]TQV79415.1 cytochrome c [Exilibacterium tricleocarpae]
MKFHLRFFTVTILSLIITSQAYAQEKQPTPEERAYTFRTSLFQTFAWKYGQLVGAKKQNDEATFIKHASDLEYLATMLEEGFQIKNSLPEGTAAKPEIWKDYDTFKKKSETLKSAANDLTKSGAMADFDARDFGSKNCGGCHRDFRVKDD